MEIPVKSCTQNQKNLSSTGRPNVQKTIKEILVKTSKML